MGCKHSSAGDTNLSAFSIVICSVGNFVAKVEWLVCLAWQRFEMHINQVRNLNRQRAETKSVTFSAQLQMMTFNGHLNAAWAWLLVWAILNNVKVFASCLNQTVFVCRRGTHADWLTWLTGCGWEQLMWGENKRVSSVPVVWGKWHTALICQAVPHL